MYDGTTTSIATDHIQCSWLNLTLLLAVRYIKGQKCSTLSRRTILLFSASPFSFTALMPCLLIKSLALDQSNVTFIAWNKFIQVFSEK